MSDTRERWICSNDAYSFAQFARIVESATFRRRPANFENRDFAIFQPSWTAPCMASLLERAICNGCSVFQGVPRALRDRLRNFLTTYQAVFQNTHWHLQKILSRRVYSIGTHIDAAIVQLIQLTNLRFPSRFAKLQVQNPYRPASSWVQRKF